MEGDGREWEEEGRSTSSSSKIQGQWQKKQSRPAKKRQLF